MINRDPHSKLKISLSVNKTAAASSSFSVSGLRCKNAPCRPKLDRGEVNAVIAPASAYIPKISTGRSLVNRTVRTNKMIVLNVLAAMFHLTDTMLLCARLSLDANVCLFSVVFKTKAIVPLVIYPGASLFGHLIAGPGPFGNKSVPQIGGRSLLIPGIDHAWQPMTEWP